MAPPRKPTEHSGDDTGTFSDLAERVFKDYKPHKPDGEIHPTKEIEDNPWLQSYVDISRFEEEKDKTGEKAEEPAAPPSADDKKDAA